MTHRRGRGWRGGFLGSATEQYLKLDLTKWLKVLRHLELLPRYMGQDWSEVWLQRFSGTITIWPRISFPADFINILSDPPPERLARMIHAGQQSAWPKLKFIRNRGMIERKIEEGWRASGGGKGGFGLKNGKAEVTTSLSQEDLRKLLKEARNRDGVVKPALSVETEVDGASGAGEPLSHTNSPSLSKRFSGWLTRSPSTGPRDESNVGRLRSPSMDQRRNSIISEIGRQSQVFFDDDESDMHATASEDDEMPASNEDWDGEDFAPHVSGQ